MAERSGEGAASDQDAKVLGVGLRPLLAMMGRTFLASPQCAVLLMLGGATFVVVGATAYAQIRLNAWNKPFYDALARRDLYAFLHQLLVFLVIAAVLLSLNVAQTWLNQMIKLKLREGLLGDLLKEWLEPRRAFRLAGAGEIGVNPDQRIDQDAQHLTELSTDLGIGLLQASLLLVSFVGVLWFLSGEVKFTFSGAAFSIPGYMVWCALLYAAIGSGLSWRVGRSLIPLNAERYAREADLRFALVRVNEHTDSIALHGGEADEKSHLGRDVDNVLEVMRRLVTATTRLTWITSGYGWLAIIAPILAASPGFFGGDLTLGGLMVAAGAFTQVQQSLRWFVDNFNTIADWLATLRRVATFRLALLELGEQSTKAGQIERRAVTDARITFDHLSISSPAASGALAETHAEIGPGERVLVTSASRAGLTVLFRAVAGLWTAGGGRIDLPASEPVMFLPQRPYMPPGALRDTLSYPAPANVFRDDELIAACQSVDLTRLASELDRNANWDNELTSDEAQRLAFARLLLHKPRWVCVDQAIDALSEAERKKTLTIFDHELRETAVVSFSDIDLCVGFSTRTLHLVEALEAQR
jgi:vitamin B12/bleomycin/antimicrobial peptide transport system ATP-binding/permease protein